MNSKKYRVGMLIPWVNTAMEDEIPYQINKKIGLHWSRLKPTKLPTNGHDESYMISMISQIPYGISRLEGINLNAICLGCTSASFSSSIDISTLKEYFPKAKFFSAFEAVVSQLKKLQARKIALFAPYTQDTIDKEIMNLSLHSIEVSKVIKIDYENEIRNIGKKHLLNLFFQTKLKNIDAIFFSCTGLYTMGFFDELRTIESFNIPTISSNTAIVQTINQLFDKYLLSGED